VADMPKQELQNPSVGSKKLQPWEVISNDVNVSKMEGGAWKKNVIKKKGKGSQTTGRQKGIRPSALQKSMCRRNRSYKDPLYVPVMNSLGQRKGKQ